MSYDEHMGDPNRNPDGSYKVGKGKPPEHGKFRVDDGRKRGKRAKGTKNLATDFREEMATWISVKVGGKERRVTRQRSIVMRLADNASRGQNSAIQTVLAYCERFGLIVQVQEDPVGADEANALPFLHTLTDEEFDLFGALFEKATGEPSYVSEPHPLDYLRNPDDPRNWITEQTVEGLVIDRCLCVGNEEKIRDIASRAYVSAALPRVPGCFRDLR